MNTKSIRKNKVSRVELLYVCDDDFKNDIQGIREAYGIKTNKDGIVDDEDFLKFDLILLNNSTLWDEYQKAICSLCKKYSLTDYIEDVEVFLETGMLPQFPCDEEYVNKIPRPEFFFRERDIPGAGIKVKFTIRRPIEDKDLGDWFIKYKPDIMTVVNDHFAGIKTSLIKLDKAGKILKIIALRDKKRMRFAEIADRICEEEPENPDVIDGKVNEVSVRQIYNRYKKKFKCDK